MGLHLGDCIEVMRTFEENSIDSIVTDPPAGISFMNKAWDSDMGGRDNWIDWLSQVMKEVLRVLKPGAYGFVWAIPRTSHWTGTALEKAGFEVRDVVTHLFGSGFPKSLDISKAIDKQAGVEREVVGKNPNARPNCIGNQTRSMSGPVSDSMITVPATASAKQWQGFGTALKPASEFWFLVRKPLSEKTVAANVLKWNTGGLNIDASRVEFKSEQDRKSAIFGTQPKITSKGVGGEGGTFQGYAQGVNAKNVEPSPKGRFPANLILSCNCDEQHDLETCAVAMLDEQSGFSKSSDRIRNNSACENIAMSGANLGHVSKGHKDTGGASRFFYCAKTSKSERGKDNNHPTVKPIKLMQYLIKLITPPNGTVLDPFMGSGSTGLAAKKLGFKFIGIEKEKDYLDIATRRITNELR